MSERKEEDKQATNKVIENIIDSVNKTDKDFKLDFPSEADLVEAGLLYGEKHSLCNPKMDQYIYHGDFKTDVSVIDVSKTRERLKIACEYLLDQTSKGKKILFVGTKESCKALITQAAEKLGMPYVTNRWAPGLLTNFSTTLGRINQQKHIEDIINGNSNVRKTKKEKVILKRTLDKINNMYNGIRTMNTLPNIIFIVDSNREKICVSEAVKLGITIVGLLDTDCNPDGIKYVIPGNDDSLNSTDIICKTITTYVQKGISIYSKSKAFTDSKSTQNQWWLNKSGYTSFKTNGNKPNGSKPFTKNFNSTFTPRPKPFIDKPVFPKSKPVV